MLGSATKAPQLGKSLVRRFLGCAGLAAAGYRINRNEALLESEQYQVGIALQVEGSYDFEVCGTRPLDRLLAQRSGCPAISLIGRPSAQTCTMSLCQRRPYVDPGSLSSFRMNFESSTYQTHPLPHAPETEPLATGAVFNVVARAIIGDG